MLQHLIHGHHTDFLQRLSTGGEKQTAFDCVCHDALLKKLPSYELPPCLNRILLHGPQFTSDGGLPKRDYLSSDSLANSLSKDIAIITKVSR